ncbi:WXG100 family type VII secretion target [Streptomyces rubellomurinus]|uniref:ESAT-6-like protein n=2 Tax=Streptomyces TaxID=1883 RepID=A0A0F2TBG6_STRR3|nr:WXG100 family type VII secretion target [Streptomyces rubellomurinus]KJS54659.1 hypothetical protein VM98_17840 [Streptomyces rubellomurinus subsp. indigoferus]KJS59072.1 hypothetical protein VM95_29420 [Streptomyces rubellomurinus]
MSDQIHVNFETLHHASEEVKNVASRIDHLLNDLKGNVKKISGSWVGKAQEGYQAHQTQWDTRAAHLQSVCKQIADALESAAVSYRQTEDANAKNWS